jgi:predicted ester cyclase
MNVDHNKALVCRVIEEVWNKGDLSVIPEVYAADFVSHQHSHPDVGDVQGVAALAAFVREIWEAFPDFYDTIDDQVAEGDKVVTRFTSTGTHPGGR